LRRLLRGDGAGPEDRHDEGAALIIDLGGDDIYTGPVRFEETLAEYLRKNSGQPVYLRAAKNVRWEFMIDIIAKIKRQGVTDLGLVTAPYERPVNK